MATIDVAKTIVDTHSEEAVLRHLLVMLGDARQMATPEAYEARVLEESADLVRALVKKKYGETDAAVVL